ncbi:putative RNA 3'-terminal phosphate cyclase [Aspergillus novofumigatus IBT 16806]|uniref:Putative RNA 3'-terminal phosphate cyclase n=1 Tax=Aspergillus novofumigatus (strain IBT 16806) TaxID=1392255 RepID=A0A2I1CHE3_ASPN1|nr:putative RNA 3'-terminal phosphate cyclase [Aspergillus novofumigatus IBT 16806]PKX97027.1 putative RNA 3'-terminal phosphate cyclase [Aspergillus novofumigatus IBT 16806]
MSSSPTRRERVHLDGRTLEGGGQLVRIALALSTITGQPITIDHIRGNRTGKKGLKASHLAAIKYLADVSGSAVSGAEVGSSSLTYHPLPDAETCVRQNRDINIQLPTAGAISLVFQALYPYLLHGNCISDEEPQPQPVRVKITGGTNVSFSPSYDYISQVLVPNFARVGLPPLAVRLEKRGWATGPFSLGKVTFVIHPMDRNQESPYGFPPVDLDRCLRGKITQIDITVLAPDTLLFGGPDQLKDRRKENSRTSKDTSQSMTIRQFIEYETMRMLRSRLQRIPSSIVKRGSADSPEAIPINLHTSERTHHRSHIHILIVAHTSYGFKLGREALYGAHREDSQRKTGGRRGRPTDDRGIATELIDRCVDDFVSELYDPGRQSTSEGRQPCVDEYMRDQLVIFEALGKSTSKCEANGKGKEDERYYSLHTQTARWVCEQMLDVEW